MSRFTALWSCSTILFKHRSYWIPGSYDLALSEKRNSFLRLLKNKGFKEERKTKVGLDAIDTSTTLESNKSLPALSQRSFLACHRPYAERRTEDTPAVSPLPEAFRNKTVRQLLSPTRHQLRSGICLRRCSVHFMLRPTRLLALLDWSDLA